MPKLKFHTDPHSRDKVAQRRQQENLTLTPAQRFQKACQLMALSAMFKKGPLKKPKGKGVVLKRKPSE